MNSDADNEAGRILDKGKGRAEYPTEHTPLLLNTASQSSSEAYVANSPATPEVITRRLRSKLVFVFLISLSISVVSFIILALLAWSYAAQVSRTSPGDIVQKDLVFHGPDRVVVLNVSLTGELWLSMDARMGFDAGSAVGVNQDPTGDGFLRGLWKAIGRWGIRQLDIVSVNLSTMSITSEDDPSSVLASVDVQPIAIPLTAAPSPDTSWLTDVSLLLFVRPTNDTSTLLHFLRHSWQQGYVGIHADIGHVSVHGGGLGQVSWRDMFHQELSNLRTSMRILIPQLPGLPHPGHNIPFPSISDLVTLKFFNVYNSPNNLSLRASATIINPAPPSFKFTSPTIPFIISLPPLNSSTSSPVPVASVSTAPFTLTHPNITLDISGTVLPLPADSTANLSSFMSRYLSGQPNPILISSPLVSGLSIETIFPAPNPRPRILQNVTIRNMKVKPGTPFLASGTVFARIVLPKGMDVGLHVSHVLPDVLIFDGEVPELLVTPPKPSLPDPLPERAFGRIRPDDWLKSLSTRDKSQGEGAAYVVTAKIVDIPLEVLPGRQKEFSNFVSKVVFGSNGAVAGILGSTAVSVGVQGLPFPGKAGEMELDGLPFQGSVRVGEKALFS